MTWKKRLISLITGRKYRQFIQDTHFPEKAVQRLWVKETYPKIKDSPFWQQRAPDGLPQQLELFPITTYEDYAEELHNALNSKIQPFNNEPILFWAETSATSGKRKYFPITKSFQRQFQRTMGPYFYSLIKRFPNFLSAKILYLAAYKVHQTSAGGIPMGLISYFNYQRLPKLIKFFYALPNEVFENAEMFHQWAPLYALAQDLNAIFAITPMAIGSFYDRCAEQFAYYLPYLLGEKELPDSLPRLAISHSRKKYLRTLDPTARHSYQTIWPSLIFAGTWIVGPCHQFAIKLAQELGPSISLVDGTYSATEGWMTVPLETDHAGGVLHPGAHIVEFIEEGQPTTSEFLKQGWDLEVGKRYEVFLTTAMGFVRYQLKDVVKCTGFCNRAPRLEFCYKSAQIRLDACSISEQELRTVIGQLDLMFEPWWYFARDAKGERLVLVIDDESIVEASKIQKIHEVLIEISEPYAYGVQLGSIQPIAIQTLSKTKMLNSAHAQTKPRLISQEVISQ